MRIVNIVLFILCAVAALTFWGSAFNTDFHLGLAVILTFCAIMALNEFKK